MRLGGVRLCVLRSCAVRAFPYWRRVAVDRWVCPTTPLALMYAAGTFTLFSGGAPICDLQSLEEAYEALADLLEAESAS
jgi:hypothetical protein